MLTTNTERRLIKYHRDSIAINKSLGNYGFLRPTILAAKGCICTLVIIIICNRQNWDTKRAGEYIGIKRDIYQKSVTCTIN